MKKTQILVLGLLIGGLLMPAFAGAVNSTFPGTLKEGKKSEEVKLLQEALSTDTNIYPSQLNTGYFGKLTEEAVRKLQIRYDLPATGVVDSETWEIIFPRISSVRVITPNGGEDWEKGDVVKIQWNATVGPRYTPQPYGNGHDDEYLVASPEKYDRPYFQKASIVLLKDSDPQFRRHVAYVDLFETNFRWEVPTSIPSAKDYRIEISVGYRRTCNYPPTPYFESGRDIEICDLAPHYFVSDTSDRPFSIYGDPTPPEDVARLKARVLVIERQVTELQKEIDQIQRILSQL